MDKNTKQTNVIPTVWRHWKEACRKNALGIFLTFLFFSISSYFNLMMKPTQWKLAFDELAHGGDPWPAFKAIALVSFFAWASSRIGEYALAVMEANVIKELKDYVLKGLMRKNTHFFSTHPLGGLVAKAKRFAAESEKIIDQFLFSLVTSALFVLYLLIYTFIVIPKITPILLCWVFLFILVTTILSKARMKYDLQSSTQDSATTGYLSDILSPL